MAVPVKIPEHSSDVVNFKEIDTGHNYAGNGGDGHFYGAQVNEPLAVNVPINVATASYHSVAYANQYSDAHFNQDSYQIAGNGGNGGSDNFAMGGSLSDVLNHFDTFDFSHA
jgi:hypothetical protein